MNAARVGPLLDALLASTDWEARIARDPVWFVRRYARRDDREVAGVVASALAFGRVAAFWPVLVQVFAVLDAAGGPGLAAADPRALEPLRPLVYRWVRGPDLIALLVAVGRVRAQFGDLEAPQHAGDAREGLNRLVGALSDAAPSDRGHGLKSLFARPASGSACKRWCMYLRWMVRRDAVDLGEWSRDPATLVIPLDTHVLRIAGYLGLTNRTDASWRTAVAVTDQLRALDPADPVRYDFALAHLGISGACRGGYAAGVCEACTLFRGCSQVEGRGPA